MRNGRVIFLSGTKTTRSEVMKNNKQNRLTGMVIIGLLALLLGVSVKTISDKHQERQQAALDQKEANKFFAWRGHE